MTYQDLVSRKLDELLAPWNQSDAPGVICGVSKRGKTIYRRAVGLASIEHARALTPATRMRIGSTTKHFCALGILMLAEEGKLDLERSVGEWLPELGPISGRPTLLQLMRHTGGLHDPLSLMFVQNAGAYTQLAPGGHLQVMARFTECSFEPGARFAYSNSGYELLSRVTEHVSGMAWPDFIQSHVLGPMGLRDTTVVASDLDIVSNIATLHIRTPEGRWRRGIYPSDENHGSGGIVSTVDDMLVWSAQVRGGQRRVGSEAVWKMMLQRQTFDNGKDHCYGLGLMVEEHRGVRIIHHAGATMGSTHQMLTAPEHELDIVVMSNRMDVSSTALALKVLEAVLEPEALSPEAAVPMAADYPAIQGRWYSRSSQTLIGIDAHALRPDGPPGVVLSSYNQLIGPLRHEGQGLALVEGPFSTFEIREPVRREVAIDHLDVHICGDHERFERLPDVPPSVESVGDALCGRYRQPGYPKEVEIAVRDGRLVLDLMPLQGCAYWDLQVLSKDVACCGPYHSNPTLPLPNNASLSFDYEAGRVVSFTYNTDRVRRVRFVRV